VLPVPLSRWSHHTPRSRTSQPNSGTDHLIPVNNPLERILREIRRRTRVVGAFPDGQSALNLAAARLRHIAGTAWSTKRYLNIELLKDQQMRGAITA
jgi:transposase-like protein